jgi:hypothetical protein
MFTKKKSFMLINTTVFFLILFLFSPQILSQKKLMFGLNSVFTDPVLHKLISLPQPTLLEMFKDYHIQYLRYPGGIPTRYYFWDRPDLIDEALKYHSSYLEQRGDKRSEYYSNYSENVSVPETNYQDFLNFCNKNKIIPFIELNTTLYVDNNKLYQYEKFQKQTKNISIQENRWEKIGEYIKSQMKFTHAILDNVIWEFGNEDYFMFDAEEYGTIVINLMDIIHKNYPNDKIIVEMSNSWSKGARKKQWNKTFIAFLDKKGALNKIDYFAPHFYDAGGEQYDNSSQMVTKILKNNVTNFENAIMSNFPSGFQPKLFYTEYACVLTSLDNKNYSTQLHGLLTLNYFMRFYASPNIVGIIQHAFTTIKNAFFYAPSLTSRFDYITEKNSDSDIFSYIPPQSEAVKLFYNTCADNVVSFYSTDSYLFLCTETNNKYKVQILNFEEHPSDVDLSSISSNIGSKNGSVNTYIFDDLNAHYWNPEKNVKKSELNSNKISVPKHSFTSIVY